MKIPKIIYYIDWNKQIKKIDTNKETVPVNIGHMKVDIRALFGTKEEARDYLLNELEKKKQEIEKQMEEL